MIYLEMAYYWSQIILTVIAGLAAIGAYLQLQTMKRFKLLEILEDPKVRKARRLLHKKLWMETPSAHWWDSDDELDEAAGTVCASYDIMGLMAKGANRRLFIREWTYNICWTYEALTDYLAHRGHAAYGHYRKLYRQAKPFDSHPRPARPN